MKPEKGENNFQDNIVTNLCDQPLVVIYSWFSQEPVYFAPKQTNKLNGSFMEIYWKRDAAERFSPNNPYEFAKGAKIDIVADKSKKPKHLAFVQKEDKDANIEQKVIEWSVIKDKTTPMTKKEKETYDKMVKEIEKRLGMLKGKN